MICKFVAIFKPFLPVHHADWLTAIELHNRLPTIRVTQRTDLEIMYTFSCYARAHWLRLEKLQQLRVRAYGRSGAKLLLKLFSASKYPSSSDQIRTWCNYKDYMAFPGLWGAAKWFGWWNQLNLEKLIPLLAWLAKVFHTSMGTVDYFEESFRIVAYVSHWTLWTRLIKSWYFKHMIWRLGIVL